MTRDAFFPPAGRPSTAIAADCHGDACITCSDAAVAVRIRELVPGHLAVVDTDGGPEEVSVALVDAAAGDVVLVHAKEAIAVVEKAR
ncbi:HypC/HybG/HupF family hydrogenase formation chaperone [Micromonospora sp. NPDC049460]|uniref:HypC/HybG/HupF family hydrogenase formation chaperone n=1 Tax=unclassified Micromonospora TaxID=2617518 RepID=UPI00371B1CC4